MTPFPYRLIRLSAPVLEPVTLAEAKLYLRVDHTAEDAQISGMIRAATARVETLTGRSLLAQDWRFETEAAPPLSFLLPRGPLTAILGVSGLMVGGAGDALTASEFRLAGVEDGITLTRRPVGGVLRVEYRAGAASVADIPAPLVQAVLQIAALMYEARGAATLPEAVTALIAPYRLLRM